MKTSNAIGEPPRLLVSIFSKFLFGQHVSSHNLNTHQCGFQFRCHMGQCSHCLLQNQQVETMADQSHQKGNIFDFGLLYYALQSLLRVKNSFQVNHMDVMFGFKVGINQQHSIYIKENFIAQGPQACSLSCIHFLYQITKRANLHNDYPQLEV